jgi:hypothetical protein
MRDVDPPEDLDHESSKLLRLRLDSEPSKMHRRHVLKSLGAVAATAVFARPRLALAALPKMKITRIRAYDPPKSLLSVNQIFQQIFSRATSSSRSRPMLESQVSAKVDQRTFSRPAPVESSVAIRWR